MVEKHLDNRRVLTEFILAGQTDFYRLAYSYVKDRDTALDVVQESIVKALTKAGSLRDPARVKTWFYRILVNESIDWYRRSQRLVPLADRLDQEAAPEPDHSARLDLYDAIERLNEKERTVVRLRYFEDLKLEEIAQVTGVNLNTVKTRLYKGLRHLKDWTEEDLNDA